MEWFNYCILQIKENALSKDAHYFADSRPVKNNIAQNKLSVLQTEI